MPIEKSLEDKLQKLAPGSKTGIIIAEQLFMGCDTITAYEISHYLTNNGIQHCSLPFFNHVAIFLADYAEMKALDKRYPVPIRDIGDPFRKVKNYSPLRLPKDGFDLKDEPLESLVQHLARFDPSRYQLTLRPVVQGSISAATLTYEKLFNLIHDPEIVSIELTKKMSP